MPVTATLLHKHSISEVHAPHCSTIFLVPSPRFWHWHAAYGTYDVGKSFSQESKSWVYVLCLNTKKFSHSWHDVNDVSYFLNLLVSLRSRSEINKIARSFSKKNLPTPHQQPDCMVVFLDKQLKICSVSLLISGMGMICSSRMWRSSKETYVCMQRDIHAHLSAASILTLKC